MITYKLANYEIFFVIEWICHTSIISSRKNDYTRVSKLRSVLYNWIKLVISQLSLHEKIKLWLLIDIKCSLFSLFICERIKISLQINFKINRNLSSCQIHIEFIQTWIKYLMNSWWISIIKFINDLIIKKLKNDKY